VYIYTFFFEKRCIFILRLVISIRDIIRLLFLWRQDIDGKDVALNKFKGKVMLIVNVASRCGLTSSNYSELSHLYEKYKTQGEF